MYCSKRYFCPVPDCVTKSSKSTGFTDSEMKRHWSEKHEEFVLMYHCSQCNFSAKRKGNILRHFRTLHRYLPFSSGPQQWKVNKEYICPQHYTLNYALGKINPQ
ncbi:hypothetical protein RRG08_051325 [Elysia crispata]|uniref:C2H2-type domain-containing protein n=1 Tax=Elysia crispata TaxID=231223 RepID=A0AAE1B4Z4_9GAST|nr:hypothetical protein RRG08_051325 [Elysia crispata]